MKRDLEQLKLLSVFHYVVGAIAAIFSMFPIIHLTIGLGIVSGAITDGVSGPPVLFGWFFVLIAATIILAGLTLAASLVAAGYFLSQQRHRMFCIVVAAISTVFTPFGTVLGVFTLIVLMRESVVALFERNQEAGG